VGGRDEGKEKVRKGGTPPPLILHVNHIVLAVWKNKTKVSLQYVGSIVLFIQLLKQDKIPQTGQNSQDKGTKAPVW
jgi:hypothetical protein